MKGRRLTAFAVLGIGLLGLASCGGSGAGVSSDASSRLQLRVAAIRTAAAHGDRDTAAQQLADLRADVVRFRADDEVDDSAATRILRAADAVQTELSLLEPAPTTTSSTTTTTTKPRGKDKGKGGKHGDEGD